ncbi:MAG: sugar nucleotide-binding protein [Oscillospiraceae bacterium]|nr:sugar nucleotide-binding protein [Oscillospiraceae bacterium]
MKRMLVTGGSGFLGSRVVKFFETKYEVLAPTRQQMDITDEKRVCETVLSFRPDVVIHCAAMSDVGRCQREPEVSWAWNVTGSIYVAKAAGLVGAKCLLCSSDQVYFATPENLYAQEKLTAEREGLQINPDCVFLRLSWMYDPDLTSTSQRSDFFTNLLQKLPTEEPVSFAVYDRRGVTDVHVVIRNMEKAIALPGGVYDFGAPNDRTMYETALYLFKKLGLDPGRVLENREAFRESPRDMSMDQSAINSFGITFEDTAEALARNFLKYRNT